MAIISLSGWQNELLANVLINILPEKKAYVKHFKQFRYTAKGSITNASVIYSFAGN